MTTTFRLPRDFADAIVRQALHEHPNEACGLLAGTFNDGRGEATRVFPMTNAERSPVIYRMEPAEQLKAFNEIDRDGLELVGIYHSHTRSPAYPSSTDVNLAYYPDALYLIVSLRDMDNPELRGFAIDDGKVTEVTLDLS
jgi:proteasome lid subunit RPN8/RPN11